MADPKDIRVDPESVWIRAKWLAPVLTLLVPMSVTATVLYMQIVNGQARADERVSELTKSVDNLTQEVQRMFVDVVMTRQGQAWIEMARALNREKHPTIIWPDLPR